MALGLYVVRREALGPAQVLQHEQNLPIAWRRDIEQQHYLIKASDLRARRVALGSPGL